MPAITRGTSKTKLIAARTGTAFKHVSAARDVGAGKTATKVRLRLTVENWDALHTLTPKLTVAGAPVAASSVEDQILPSGVLIRTAHFSFAANRYFTPVIEGARHASKPPYIVLDRYDYAAG